MWTSALALAVLAIGTGAVVIFGWMVDETHFDRPSAQFDELETQLARLPAVEGVVKERWVEAPTFSGPTSWISVEVDEAGFADVLDLACSTTYPDPVAWSIRVRTPSATEVSLHASPTRTDAQCPAFGFDAPRLVDELDRVAPGLAVQPAIWDNGEFALVALEDDMSEGFTHLLPVAERADELLDAAGLDGDQVVEINSANLGVVIEPGQGDAYVAMLTELAEDQGVTSFWADSGAQADGVDKVQVVAPDGERAAIERIIRASGLPVADLPVRFIEQ